MRKSAIFYFIYLIFLIAGSSMADEHSPNSTYILGTGKQGASNLDLQHEIFEQESIA